MEDRLTSLHLYGLAKGRFCMQVGGCHYFHQEAVFRLSRLSESHWSDRQTEANMRP
jgi:hypothetical protein